MGEKKHEPLVEQSPDCEKSWAGVGEKLIVGSGVVGSGLGEASLVAVSPPPQVQHMSFEEKSESS